MGIKIKTADEVAASGNEARAVTSSNGNHSLLDFYTFLRDHMESIPWDKLENVNWVTEGRSMESLAPLFRCFRSQKKNPLFKKSNGANDLLLSFWVARIEVKAKEAFIESRPPAFRHDAFNKDVLFEISRMSKYADSMKNLKAILAQYGVLLVYEKGPPGMKCDGVVTKLDTGTPIIGMSLRFNRLDNFWFTLMHELTHIVLHYDQIDSPLIDDLEAGEQENLLERQANRLAQDIFVCRKDWNRCPPKYEMSVKSVVSFADKLGIHPAIVAGRLRRETQDYRLFYDIVHSVNVVKVLEGQL